MGYGYGGDFAPSLPLEFASPAIDLGAVANTHTTITKTVGVPVPAPYPVTVEKRVPVPVPYKVAVPVDRYYFIYEK